MLCFRHAERNSTKRYKHQTTQASRKAQQRDYTRIGSELKMIVEKAIELYIKKIDIYIDEAANATTESNRRAALKMAQEATNGLKELIKLR